LLEDDKRKCAISNLIRNLKNFGGAEVLGHEAK